jgi:uncharacterized iron-regulated protein
MLKKILFIIMAMALILSVIPALQSEDAYPVHRLADGATISAETFTEALASHHFILVGERHTDENHHQGQLHVIRSLAEKGLPVAIGMEMMRSDSQPYLDAWVAGKLSEAEFLAVYRDNWNYPWPLYRPIFIYAREQGIPLIGLNVARAITRQVAQGGFDSLSAEQRGDLPFVTCRVDDDYLAFIKEAYGAHAHGNMQFEHFCEAQLVWDKAMAVNAVKYLEKAPESRIVILAGTGHARKGGIPRQLESLGQRSFAVVLPEIPSVLDPRTVDTADADYLLRLR